MTSHFERSIFWLTVIKNTLLGVLISYLSVWFLMS
jgi:hypothetical protein